MNDQASPRKGIRFSADVRDTLSFSALPTLSDIRKWYGPAQTLGAPEGERLAMDGALADSGLYSMLQQGVESAMLRGDGGGFPRFMGYGLLQNLAQNGLIRACVETVTDDMTRAWIDLKREGEAPASADGSSDTLIPELNAAMKRFDCRRLFHEAVELVGYEGGALLFIDTGARGKELLTPLRIADDSAELRPGRLRGFRVVDPVNVFPGDYNSGNPLRDDYFRPRTWWVLGQQVHSSRLIRLVANECPVLLRPAYNFFGIPQAQILYDYVMHFQECREAESRLLTSFSLTTLKTDMGDVLAGGGTENLDMRMRFFLQHRSNEGLLCIDKESEDIVKLETPLSGVTDIVRQALEFLAAMNRTPAVKLLGVSPSGFNATGKSDILNYHEHIAGQQEKVLRSALQTVLDVLQLDLRGVIDPNIHFSFASLSQEDRSTIAERQKLKAETLAAYLDRNVILRDEARRSLANDPDSGFNDISTEE